MILFSLRLAGTLALFVAVVVSPLPVAFGANIVFKDIDGPQDFALDTNWDGDLAPAASDHAFINTSTMPGDLAYLDSSFTVLNLTLADLAADTGRLELRDGADLTLTGAAVGPDRVASLGRNGLGAVDLLGGSNLSLTNGDVRLGENSGATGQLTQQALSDFTIGGSLAIGMFAGGAGTYTMQGGTLDVATFMIVGRQGAGTFQQYGGDVLIHRNDNPSQPALFLGSHGGSTSLYEIHGGSLTIDAALNAGLQIGPASGTGNSTLRIVGGDATIDIGTNLVHKAGGTLEYMIDSSISSIDVAGDVTLADLLLNVVFTSQPQMGDQFTLINYGGELTGEFGGFDFLADGPGGVNSILVSLDYGSGTAGAIVLTVVPEPASLAMLAMIVVGCATRWRRSQI